MSSLCASAEADIGTDLIIGVWVLSAEIIEAGTAGVEVTEAIVVNTVEITAKSVMMTSSTFLIYEVLDGLTRRSDNHQHQDPDPQMRQDR